MATMSNITLVYEEENFMITHNINVAPGTTYPELIQGYINFLNGIGYVVPEEENFV